MTDVVVVGAGITGLVAAFGLQQAGLQVVVLDAGEQPGGVIQTVQQSGCQFERGPNSALDTTPLIGELLARLGIEGERRAASTLADRRYVVRGGVPTPLPMSPGAFLSTPLFSLSAKLGLMREPFLPASDPQVEESIAAFVRRRLGEEFLDYAIDPFVAGIYAGDPETISVRAAFPKLHALEQRWGSLIRGQFLGARERRRQKETAKNSAGSFSFAAGMQALPKALAAQLPGLELRTRASALSRDAQGLFTVDAEQAGRRLQFQSRALLLATPTGAAAALLRDPAPEAAVALEEIAYAPVATVASLYRRSSISHALDGFGCLVPRKEQRQVLGVLFSSSMFDGRASDDHVLLTTFVGGQRNPGLPGRPEAEIAALVHAEHATLLGAHAAPEFQAVTRWPRAIPQYTIGHLGRVARADSASSALPGLFLAGSWKGGVSVGDCIKNGHLQAETVAAYLRDTQQRSTR